MRCHFLIPVSNVYWTNVSEHFITLKKEKNLSKWEDNDIDQTIFE